MISRGGPGSEILLFVNQHYRPDIAATGQLLTDLAEHLSRVGFDVEVWCGRGRYVEGELTEPSIELLNGVTVRRFRTTAFPRWSKAGRLTNYLFFYLQYADINKLGSNLHCKKMIENILSDKAQIYQDHSQRLAGFGLFSYSFFKLLICYHPLF